jgi:hypothetical protein
VTRDSKIILDNVSPAIGRLLSVTDPLADSSRESCRSTAEGCPSNGENLIVAPLRTRSNFPFEGHPRLLPLGHAPRLRPLFLPLVPPPTRPVYVHTAFFPPPVSLRDDYLALQEKKAVTTHDGRPRRHTHDVWEVKLVRSATQLFRTTFSGAVTATLAVVRLRIRIAKKKKQATDNSDDTTVPSPGCIPRPPCGGWYCAYALLNGPLVVCYHFSVL